MDVKDFMDNYQGGDLPEYDEAAAIATIRAGLSEETNARLTDDHIVEIIDLIFDFFDNQPDDIEAGSDDDFVDTDEVVNYVLPLFTAVKLTREEMDKIINLEMDYEDTISPF